MGEVVHGVGVPLCTGTVMGYVDNTIEDGVAKVHVGVAHVETCAEHHTALYSLSGVHLAEQAQTLFPRAVAEGRWGAGLGGCAFLTGNLFGGLLVDIGVSMLDEPLSEVP